MPKKAATMSQIDAAAALIIAQNAFGPTARVKEANSPDPSTKFRVAYVPDGQTSPVVVGYGASGYAEALQRAFISDPGQKRIAELDVVGNAAYLVNEDGELVGVNVWDGTNNTRFEYAGGLKGDWLDNHSQRYPEDEYIADATVTDSISAKPLPAHGTSSAPLPGAPVPASAAPAKKGTAAGPGTAKVSIPQPSVNPGNIKTGLMGWDEDVTPAAILAAISGEHLLIVGPPGAAKSLFARRFFAHLEGSLFETQLSKYADETALFGAPNLKRLREDGVFEYPKHGIAARDWGFIDEIFDSSDVLLRTLLGILQEKKFTKGGHEESIPLQSVIATANYTRVNEVTSAVIDRFAFTVSSPVLTAKQRERLYANESFEEVAAPKNLVTLDQLTKLRESAKQVVIPESIVGALVSWAGEMGFTPRRERKLASIIRSSAALAGRRKADENDIMAARFCVPVSNSGVVENATKSLQPLKDAILQTLHEGQQLAELGKLSLPVECSDTSDARKVVEAIKAVKVRTAALREFKAVSEKVNTQREAAITALDQQAAIFQAQLGF